MTLMTEPMTAARGILSLMTETVSVSELGLAYSTLNLGYPLDAVFFALVAAHESHSPVSDNVRELVLSELTWPQDELTEVLSELSQIPRLAA